MHACLKLLPAAVSALPRPDAAFQQHSRRFPQFFNRPSTEISRASAKLRRSPNTIDSKSQILMARRASIAKVYQFPLPLEAELPVGEREDSPKSAGTPNLTHSQLSRRPDVVISGTYRKDNEGLKRAYEELRDLGCRVLSPTSVSIVSERDGFVYMEGEQTELPENIELRHLSAIQEAQFMWLHAPDGYVGLSAALEVGFAHAIGVPIYSTSIVTDPILASFVRQVESPARLVVNVLTSDAPHVPRPAVQAFQNYYRRAAIERGYGKESARDTLLLMVEEVGELARAIRKQDSIKRHGKPITEEVAPELADVFIYVVHMANVLGLSLSEIVTHKELRNVEKIIPQARLK